jgi:competence protein ComGC
MTYRKMKNPLSLATLTFLLLTLITTLGNPSWSWDFTMVTKKTDKSQINPMTSMYSDQRLLDIFSRKTGIDPFRDIKRVVVLGEIKDNSVVVGLAIMGTFDNAKLTNELLSDKELNAKEGTIGKTKYFTTENFNIAFLDGMIVGAPAKTGLFNSPAILDKFLADAKALDTKCDMEIKGIVTPALREKIIEEITSKKQIPEQAVMMLKGIEAITITNTSGDIAITATTDTPELATMGKTYFNGITGMGSMILAGMEKDVMDKAESVSAFKLLTQEYMGKMQMVNLGKKLLEKIKVEANGPAITLKLNTAGMLGDNQMMLPVVAAVVGIGAAIAIPNFQKARTKARSKSCSSNMRVLEGALEMYQMDYSDTQIQNGLINDLYGDVLISEGYIKSKPECRDGGVYKIIGAPEAIEIECSVHGTVSKAMNK